jgi:hypothetical protein
VDSLSDRRANWWIMALCGDAAERLTGRPVKIVWEKPWSERNGKHVSGTAQKAGNGALITIDPTLPRSLVYKVLLHESAHIADPECWEFLHDMNSVKAAPDISNHNSDPEMVKTYAIMEASADRIAARWDAWATNRTSNSIGARLLELSTCWPY